MSKDTDIKNKRSLKKKGWCYMFTYHGITISAEEILKYSRKSRTDDPLMTVEEILEKHESILNEWSLRNLGELVPENNSFKSFNKFSLSLFN